MHSFVSVWRARSRRVKLALLAVPVVCLVAASSAMAADHWFGHRPNPLNPSVQDAAKIVGVQQLVATYVQDLDWGPSDQLGFKNTQAIGDLFTPNGNWQIMYWNAGQPVPVTWTAADGPGPDYNGCSNIGPAAVARAFGGQDNRLTTTDSHHNINNVQVTLDPGGRTATVRGEMDIKSGAPNAAVNGGSINPIWTGHYYGRVVLTNGGWRFQLWEPIVDQPINMGALCAANNPAS